MLAAQQNFNMKLESHSLSSPISRTDSTTTSFSAHEKSDLSSLENSPVEFLYFSSLTFFLETWQKSQQTLHFPRL